MTLESEIYSASAVLIRIRPLIIRLLPTRLKFLEHIEISFILNPCNEKRTASRVFFGLELKAT